MEKKESKFYSKLSEEARKKQIAASVVYNREKCRRTTIKMSIAMDAAMTKYIEEKGIRSKNKFICDLIKKEIGFEE